MNKGQKSLFIVRLRTLPDLELFLRQFLHMFTFPRWFVELS